MAICMICFVCRDVSSRAALIWRNDGTHQETICSACYPFWRVSLALLQWLDWRKQQPGMRCAFCDRRIVDRYYRIIDTSLPSMGAVYAICETCVFTQLRVLVAGTALAARRHAEAATASPPS